MMWMMWVLRMGIGDMFDQWWIIVVGSLVSVYIYRHVVSLKAVSVDDEFLYVSDYFKEISVPLSEIEDVTQSGWIKNQSVKIHLSPPSEFGDKIAFMPTTRFFNFGSHPVVDELKQLAEAKKAHAGYVRQRPVYKSMP
jgi:hypothetical protein